MRSFTEEAVKISDYSILAGLYDKLMEHVNYSEWAGYLFELCGRFEHKPCFLLECACGTGSFMGEFLKTGIFATGMDRSFDMLVQTIRKNKRYSNFQGVFNACLSTYVTKNKFDTVLCMYDSLNYIKSPDMLKSALMNMYDSVSPGGVMIFDMATEYNSMNYFAGEVFKFKTADYDLTRRCFYREKDKIQIIDFTIIDRKTGTIYKEKHFEYIRSFKEISETLKEIIPGNIRFFKDRTFSKPDEQTERIVFYIEKN